MREDRHADAGSSPVEQSHLARERPDLVLRQIRLVERTADAELARRLAARAIVAAVVGVAAIGHDGKAPFACDGGQVGVEFVLTVVTPVRFVRAVRRVLDLRGLDELVLQMEFGRDANGELAMASGIAGTVGRHAEDVVGTRFGRGAGEERAVDAAAVAQPGSSPSP